jgi:hypothetical protein
MESDHEPAENPEDVPSADEIGAQVEEYLRRHSGPDDAESPGPTDSS